jgi:hypothetical protein
MDRFDYLDEPSPAQKVLNLILNVLTGLLLLATVCVASVVLTIFFNPRSALNPFPPSTLPPPVALPSATVTPRSVLPPTWTPSPTIPPSATVTAGPTDTPRPTETPFLIFTPTDTPEGAASETQTAYRFSVGPNTPVGMSSLPFHPEAGCNWLGVAGQVFDLSGAAVTGQQVALGGALAGKPVDKLTLTGLTTAYGNPGYYEFVLGDAVVKSSKTIWVQLLDQAGLPMSERVYFETTEDCEKNLIVVNFKQVR